MSSCDVLVTGRGGQVARALEALSSGLRYRACPRDEADLTDGASLGAAIDRHAPAVVVNAAAYTAVDRAEEEEGLAFDVNAEGPRRLCGACRSRGVPVIHISTDYVFDGSARRPYRTDDPVRPLGAYGRSKAAGEDAVRETLGEHVILRTAWLYSESGRNFLTTMLRLGAERDELGVVDDQIGSPTYAGDLARAIDRIARRIVEARATVAWGTYHATNSGTASWFGFAREIFRIAGEAGLPVPGLAPIATADYPTPARRPAYSVLDMTAVADAFGVTMPDWRDGLGRCMERMFAMQGER